MIRLALALCLIASTADARTVRIHDNGGGEFNDFADKVQRHSAHGDQIIISGRCFSACTMLLAVPGACITRSAVLGFHGGSGPDYMKTLIEPLYATYLPLPMQQRYMAEWRFIAGNNVHQIKWKTAVQLGAKLCGE